MRPGEQNGQAPPKYYIDSLTGDHVIGAAAYDDYLESGGHPADLESLATLIRNPLIELDNPPFESPPLDKGEIIIRARFILNILGLGDSAKGLSRIIVNRSADMGAMPKYNTGVYRLFGGLGKLQTEMGLRGRYMSEKYKHHGLEEILDHLETVIAEEGKFPTEDDLWRRINVDKKDEISPRLIRKIIRLSEAMELVGRPNNANHWKDEDYYQWGVDYAIANDMLLPISDSFRILSVRGYSPSYTDSTCTGNLPRYRSNVLDRLEQQLDNIKTGLGDDSLPLELFYGVTSAQALFTRYYTYQLVCRLLPNAPDQIRIDVSSTGLRSNEFVSSLQRHGPHLTSEQAQIQARELGCFYYIFPRVDHLQNINISGQLMAHPRSGGEQIRLGLKRSVAEILDEIKKIHPDSIGRVAVLETHKLRNGFILNKLAPESPNVQVNSEPLSGEEIIKAYRKDEEDLMRRKRWGHNAISGTTGATRGPKPKLTETT